MKSNWHVSQERFKSLQVQARAARTEKDTLAKEVIELKEKMESAAVAPLLATPSAVRLSSFSWSWMCPLTRIAYRLTSRRKPKKIEPLKRSEIYSARERVS